MMIIIALLEVNTENCFKSFSFSASRSLYLFIVRGSNLRRTQGFRQGEGNRAELDIFNANLTNRNLLSLNRGEGVCGELQQEFTYTSRDPVLISFNTSTNTQVHRYYYPCLNICLLTCRIKRIYYVVSVTHTHRNHMFHKKHNTLHWTMPG